MSRWTLPKGWQWATAGEIADIVGGGTPSTKNPVNFTEKGIPWLTPADLSGYQEEYVSRGKRDLSKEGYESCGAQLMPGDAVLFTSRAPVGYCVLAANEICTNQGFKSLVLKGKINPKFIRHYLLSSKSYAESLASGSTFKELSGKRMAELEIPIPPLNEQKRIVDRIQDLQACSRRASEALKAIPDLIEQLRQSILAAAFRGDITKDWRKKNPDIEPASKLLKRIRAERRKRWEEGELVKLKAKGLTGSKLDAEFTKRRKKYKTPTPVDTTDLRQLPEGWCWVAAEELTPPEAPIIYGILQPGPDTPDGIPYVRPTEIINNNIVLDKIRRTSIEIAARYKRSELKADDVLLSMVGTIGKVAIVPTSLEGGNITQSSVRIRADREFVYSNYMAWSFRSFLLREQFEKYRLGTAVPRLNVEDVRRLGVPLAPIQEQSLIVETIEDRVEHMDNIKVYVNECRESVSFLWDSVMEKAFRGKLVAQDPNDEPASVLLERIRQANEKARARGKETKKKKKGVRGMGKAKSIKKRRPIHEVLLQARSRIAPEQVFEKAGFAEDFVDEFYEELRGLVKKGTVRELRPNDTEVYLEVVAQ